MRSRSGASGEEGVLELDPGAGSGRRAVRRPQGDQAAGSMQKTSQSMRPKAGWETEALDTSRGRCQRQTGVGSGVQGGARAREPNAGQAELLSQLPGRQREPSLSRWSQRVLQTQALDCLPARARDLGCVCHTRAQTQMRARAAGGRLGSLQVREAEEVLLAVHCGQTHRAPQPAASVKPQIKCRTA